MALMTWSQDLSVGVDSMDDQHKGLVKSLNELNAAMAAGQSRTIMATLLETLVKYTHEHFAQEEALLARGRYPQLAEHRQKHRQLTSKVEDYVRRFDEGEVALSVDLMEFLRDWLKTHIMKEDRPYGLWLNERGMH